METRLQRGVEYGEAPEMMKINKEEKTEDSSVRMNFPKPEDEKMRQGMDFSKLIETDIAIPSNQSVGGYNDTEEMQHVNEKPKPAAGAEVSVDRGYSPPSDAVQRTADMSFQLNQNILAVNEACSTMAEGLQQLQKQLQNINRVPRKEKTAYTGAGLSNRDIMAKIHYDNGTFEAVRLIENAKGPIEVAQLALESEEIPDLYAIWLSNFKQVITGKIDGNTKNKLYKAFLDVGIQFNKQIPQTRLPDILYEMFGEPINLTENVMIVPTCGGWFCKEYLHKKNFPYGKARTLAHLPIKKKTICTDNLTQEDIILYHKELVSIKDVADRKIIALYPFVSILASLLEDADKKVDTVLNIVPYESIPLERVCRWFSVSEHEHMIPVKGNSCDKFFLNTCTSVKDEVLMIDFRRSCQGSKHKKGNAKENQSNLIRTFAGTHSLEKPLHPCGLVTFSDAMYAGENVVNILLGRKSIENLQTKADVFTKVFGSFIRYVEMNYDHVKEIIWRRRNSELVSSGIFGITLEVVNYFWASKGYSTWAILATRINGGEFKSLLKRKVFDHKELVETFRKAVRKAAPNYKILSKLDKSDEDVCIRYDKEWIWIPTGIFEEVCLNHGLAGYDMQVVFAYEAMGLLVPDTFSKSVTLQVCKKRFETYKFKKDTFDKTGLPSFIDLGKEVSADERL